MQFFLKLQVPRVRFLVTLNPNKFLHPEYKKRVPGIKGWNLVKLAYQEFLKKYNIDVFENFVEAVPTVINKIQDEGWLLYTKEITKNKKGKIVDKTHQNFISGEDRPIGTVTTGTDNQPTCVPGNASITVPRKLLMLVTKGCIW